jgi:hypothetical protein
MTATLTKASKKTYEGPSPEEKIVAQLVALLEAGRNPWRKPWTGGGHHRNLLTGHHYTGSNPLLLEMFQSAYNHPLPLWVGFGMAKTNGWKVKKGAKGAYILAPKPVKIEGKDEETGEDTSKCFTVFRTVCLFNVADLTCQDDTLDRTIKKCLSIKERPENERLASAAAVLRAWEVAVRHGGDKAFYSPFDDRITMPNRQQFKSDAGYLATLAHECVHSTGHKSRLARDLYNHFGSPGYAREELVAELGAFLIGQRLEIGSKTANHASYLGGWIERLKESPKILFKVLGEAKRAADLIAPERQA